MICRGCVRVAGALILIIRYHQRSNSGARVRRARREKKMKATVTREYYQIAHYTNNSQTEPLTGEMEYSDELYYEAFRLCAERRESIVIQRVTEFRITKSDVPDVFCSFLFALTDRGDSYTGSEITGRRVISPEHFALDVDLSRYHPVNGWAIPETMEVY